MSYNTSIRLKDNEYAAKVNRETGELVEVKAKTNNIPEGKLMFEPKALFKKDYTKSWEYLDKVLTPLEFKVVAKLCRMAKMNTNSLEPLSDSITKEEIAKEFNIGRNKVTPLLKKLFDLGVYAKFDVAKPDVRYTKYWILNPYLSFSGQIINSDIAALFKGTIIEKEFSKVV